MMNPNHIQCYGWRLKPETEGNFDDHTTIIVCHLGVISLSGWRHFETFRHSSLERALTDAASRTNSWEAAGYALAVDSQPFTADDILIAALFKTAVTPKPSSPKREPAEEWVRRLRTALEDANSDRVGV